MKQTKEDLLQNSLIAGLLALFCCFLWGSAFPCIKIGYRMLSIAAEDTASQILFAGARFTLAGILAILIGSLSARQMLIPKKTSWGKVFCLCMFQTVIQYLLFYIGLANTSGVKSSIISGSNVFFSILISSLLFHYEKLSAGKILGCLLGFAGVVLINVSGSVDASVRLTGEGFLLLSTLSSAMSAALSKKFSRSENPVTLSGWQFLAGGLIMTVTGLCMGGRLSGFSGASALLLLYMAFISAAAYSVWSILLKHNPVGRIAVFGFMTPVFGFVLSALILQEESQISAGQALLSLVLVCAGIFLVNRDFGRKKTPGA